MEKNVYQRMNQIMKEVKYIKKREKKSGMQYSFVSHDDVTALLHEPLADNGLFAAPSVLSYKIEGNVHTVNLSVDFVNVDKPEEKITVQGWGYGIDTQDKGYGKAVSYALKYILLKTFLLESGDEDEIDAYQEEKPKNPPKVSARPEKDLSQNNETLPQDLPITKEQKEKIRELIQPYPEIREEVLKFANKKLVQDIEQSKYLTIIGFIETCIKKGKAA